MQAQVAKEKAAADGTLQRRRELASGNVRLAYYLAHRYKGIISEDDAISVALEALWIAALRYDPERKTPFSTYAGVIITNALRTAIRRSKQTEIACLNESANPEDPYCIEDKLCLIQDPISEGWEDKRADRIDCLKAMRSCPGEGNAMILLRDVYGYTISEASHLLGLRSHIGSIRRKKTLKMLRSQFG